MDRSADVLIPATAEVGEGPVWLSGGGLLSWVDITAGVWHRSTLDGGRLQTASGQTTSFDTMLGALTPASDGGWVAAVAEGFWALDADGAITRRAEVLPDPAERMNDAKCDSRGRYWAGVTALDFTPGRGRLLRLDADWTVTGVLEELTLPNGLGWSPDDRTFYLIDSEQYTLFAFDFDAESGELSGRRTLQEWSAADGFPDGLSVAADGSLWIAFWGGSAVRRYAADGRLLETIGMPVRQPASCAFLDGTTLAITTARRGLTAEQLEQEPLAGSVFVTDAGVAGVPVAAFAGPTGQDGSVASISA